MRLADWGADILLAGWTYPIVGVISLTIGVPTERGFGGCSRPGSKFDTAALE